MTVRFVSITFPGADADADCFAMCAACARGDSFLRSRQAGRGGGGGAAGTRARIGGRGHSTLHSLTSGFVSLRFVWFPLIAVV